MVVKNKNAELLTLCESNAWADVVATLKTGKVPSKQISYANEEGLTALHLACLEEQMEAVQLLLKAGADPAVSDAEGTNCLHIAATLSSPPLLRILIEAAPPKKGVALDVNATDMQGSTALHLAVEPADEGDAVPAAECVELLIKHGASASTKNAAGKTALELAALDAVRQAVEAGAEKGAKRTGSSRRKQTRGNEPATPEKGEAEKKSGTRARAKVGVTPDVDVEAGLAPDPAPAAKARRRRPNTGGADGGADDGFLGISEAAEDGKGGSAGSGKRVRRIGIGGSASRGGVRLAEGEDLSALIAEQSARLEQQLTDLLNAAEASPHEQYDLAIELLPSEYADERLEGKYERARSSRSQSSRGGGGARSRSRSRRDDDDDVDEEAAGGVGVPETAAHVTRTTLLQRIRAPSVGLHSKIVYAGERCYLLLGAPLARLAREAERIKLPMQLKSAIDERLRREKMPYASERRGGGGGRRGDADETAEPDEEIVSREGGLEAYAPYRRRVHQLFQLAAHPHFFSCAQRTLLLSSILEAPAAVGGAELKLASLQRSHVVAQVFALHHDAERQALEERWTTESSLGLAPAPITPLYNYFGADLTLYMAFLRLYSLWLWLPAVLGLVLFVFQETEYAGRESVWQALYSLCLVVWASVFLQQWTRASAKLTHQWATPSPKDIAAEEGGASVERLEFDSGALKTGFYLPSDDWVALDVDSVPEGAPSQLKPRFTWAERRLRLVASWALLAVCALVSVVLQLSLLLLRSWLVLHLGNPIGGHVLAALLTALAVEVMQAGFHPLVEALCSWQNHRSEHIHEAHFAYQLFTLSFINRFFSVFYLAVLKKLGTFSLFHAGAYPMTLALAITSRTLGTPPADGSFLLEVCRDRQGHPSNGCVEELATQVGALLLVQLVFQNAFEYGKLLLQQRRTRAAAAAHGRIYLEAGLQRSSGSAGDDFFELTMSFATVALFAGAFPPAAAIALLNNAIEARTDSYKMLRCAQRPQPRLAAHTGTWTGIWHFITLLSILTNTILVCHSTTALPTLLGIRDAGGEYALALVLEHSLLLIKLAIDWAIPDVPTARLQRLARQRKLLQLAEQSRSKPTSATSALAADAEVAAAAAAAAEAEAEDDVEPPAERQREEKMSDLGLLRSFKPVAEEQLPQEAEELHRQLQEAADPDGMSGAGASSEKTRRRVLKTRRSLIRQLSWTPFHAFSRASARPACTDVVCLLPLMLLWLVMLAVAVLGGRYGSPPRLLFGLDYELNTCGVANVAQPLRFELARSPTFPYEIHLPNARFAANVSSARQAALKAALVATGARDHSGAGAVGATSTFTDDGGGGGAWYYPVAGARSLVYYADPAQRLALCVAECPSPAKVIDGARPENLMCSYETPSTATLLVPGASPGYKNADLLSVPGALPPLNESEASPGYNATAPQKWCYPAYKSHAVAGYCVPSDPSPQWMYSEAKIFASSALAFAEDMQGQLVVLRNDILRAAHGRFFDAAFGDLVATWPLMLAIPLLCAVLCLVWALLLPVMPLALYGLAAFMTTASLSGLTYVFWSEGDERIAAAAAAGIQTDFFPECQDPGAAVPCGYKTFPTDSGVWLKNTGHCLCALTLLHLPLAGLGLAVLQPALPLLQSAGALLLSTPSAIGPPALATCSIFGFTAVWVVAGAYIASSGEIEITEHAAGQMLYSSGVKALFVVHVLGGLWTALFLKHLGQIGAAGPLSRAYWRHAEARWERVGHGTCHTLLSPFLHVGSAAYGATVCSLLEGFAFAAQLVGTDGSAGAVPAGGQAGGGPPASSRLVALLSRFQKAGYVNVALFGTSLTDGSRWASHITRRFVPQVLQLQGRLGVLLFASKFAWSVSAAAVAAAFLVGHPSFASPAHFDADGGVSNVYVVLVAVYALTYLVVSTLFATVELAVSAGVQNWCLDYKQNCVDQDLKGSTWMMAVSEAVPLQDLHDLMCDERELAADEEDRRKRAKAARESPQRRGTRGREAGSSSSSSSRGAASAAPATPKAGGKAAAGKATNPKATTPKAAGGKAAGAQPATPKSPGGKKATLGGELEDDDDDDYDDAVGDVEANAPASGETPARRRRPPPAAS